MARSKRLSILCLVLLAGWAVRAQEISLEAARHAFEKGDYAQAAEILKQLTNKDPKNGDAYLLLSRTYLEMDKYDDAVNAGERAIAINPNQSEYHRWLGEAYGAKADHAGMLSAYGLAKKTQKEFVAAVQLDEKNFDAQQDLIEYDCTAPSMVGGGEDKAEPLIQKLSALDAAEGHYATGICRAQKKDYSAADAEFQKALELHPKNANRINDIGDYFVQRKQPERVLAAAEAGERLAPAEPRWKFLRGVAYVLQGDKLPEAEKLLRDYLKVAVPSSTSPSPWSAHYFLGRLYEAQKNTSGARDEYSAALKLNAKYKPAQEALKNLGSH